MNQTQIIRQALPRILNEHGVIVAYEGCRLINGFGKTDFVPCFHLRRYLNRACNRQIRGCKVCIQTVAKELARMEKNGDAKSCKMRFWDGGKKRIIDMFRFYFIDEKVFEAKILRQTLIPYITVDK